MLVNVVSYKNFVSFPECMVQIFVFCFFDMLTVMAYGRYVAIYNTLLCNVTISHRVCLLLVTRVYSMGAFRALVHTSNVSTHFFCGTNIIHNYFCDILPLLSISCSRNYTKELLGMVFVIFHVFAYAVAILISYAFILWTFPQLSEFAGCWKG
ncbi:Olfactory receptor 8G2 [Sciurus carolinensis]|uniref:Olfactory receptor 8G2 n=1 Tax=Sciurus carolinensis TaxID=30640 RepID=A0AA41MNN6_SCICA|nr:Olfactory receptor 8G2 [Sciurus carolinensis]